MLAGTFAINMYNLTDAWFVSRLGTEALAAISFTFPVVMLLMFLTRGLGSGALTLVAHAIGGSDMKRARTLTSHALLLAVVLAALVSTLGLLTMRALFTKLGASGEVLELTARYMRIWYIGAIGMVIHLVASEIIISTGNTKAVSTIMVGSTTINAFLDWVLIFGNLGLPKMGIGGAALATLLAQVVGLMGALYVLRRKAGLLGWGDLRLASLFRSWTAILKFSVPGALGMVLTPISSAVVTRLVAGHGNAAVAAAGVASRIEMMAFMIPMTVGISLVPFVAQNYGAGRMDRIAQARRGSMTFALLYGLLFAALLMVFARSLARAFSEEQAVIDVLCTFIYITALGYGMLEVHRYAAFTLIGTHEPLQASMLNVVRALVLLIPLALAGDALFGLYGIFSGRLATDLLAGCIGVVWSGRILASKQRQFTAAQG